MSSDTQSTPQTHAFQAEVAELLRLMVHAVYSEGDIFLRELISNASDACDKLRYEAIAKPELLGRRRAARHPPDAGHRGRHADGRRYRHRHGPPGADRQPRHHRPLRHARLHEPARRGQGRHRAHRPVRRRLLLGLHGRGPHRGDEPAGGGERGVGVALVGQLRLRGGSRHRGAGRPRAPRHRGRAAPEARPEAVSRAAHDRAHRAHLLRPHPLPHRAGRGQGRPRARSTPPAPSGSGPSPSSRRRTTPRPTARSRARSTSPP